MAEGWSDEEVVEGWSDQEEMIEQKEGEGEKLNNPQTPYNITISDKETIKMFKRTRIVSQALELQSLINKNLKNLSSFFQVQLFDSLLMFKLTFDLNIMKTSQNVYESLGFSLEDLVEYVFIIDANKLSLFYEDPSMYDKSLRELVHL